jgi:hypothetical protein
LGGGGAGYSDGGAMALTTSSLESFASPCPDARIHKFLGLKRSGDGAVSYPGDSRLRVASRWGHGITFPFLGSDADEGPLRFSSDLKKGSYCFLKCSTYSPFAPVGAKALEILAP